MKFYLFDCKKFTLGEEDISKMITMINPYKLQE